MERDDHGEPTLPATSVALAGAPSAAEQQRRALEDTTLIVDDLRGAARARRTAMQAVVAVGAGLAGLFGGLNPFAMLGGALVAAFYFLPVYVVWGFILRMRLMSRCADAGVRVSPVAAALRRAARDRRLSSRHAVQFTAQRGRLLDR